MSNTKRDGDFNLDEELRSKIALNAEGDPFDDSTINEAEEKELKATDSTTKIVDEMRKKYSISQRVKYRSELIGTDTLLSVRNLKQYFFFGSGPNRQKLKAVSGVNFDVHAGECFGIVGESGCGKTTTGRSIIKLYDITSGSVYYKGFRISAGDYWNKKELKFTKLRLKQQLSELKSEYNIQLQSLDTTSPSYQENADKLLKKYQDDCKSVREYANGVIAKQREKIRQIHIDNKHAPRALVNEIQMIFQDPVDSLDPRMTVEDIIMEGLTISRRANIKKLKNARNVSIAEVKSEYKNKEKTPDILNEMNEKLQKINEQYQMDVSKFSKSNDHKRVVEMLEKVGLVAEHAARYPHEFSGGQRQRIGIARALVMNPKLLICDEPISALDVSIRAQIINLLNELKEEMGLSIIFIAHDLSVVKYFCDRIAVMYFGKIVELAPSDELFKNPMHPYTRALLSAIPKPNPIIERSRERIVYHPQEVHDYSVDKPSMHNLKENHLIYCNDAEYEKYVSEIKD